MDNYFVSGVTFWWHEQVRMADISELSNLLHLASKFIIYVLLSRFSFTIMFCLECIKIKLYSLRMYQITLGNINQKHEKRQET